MSYKRIYHGLALSQLAVGKSFTCGLINDTNRLECWPRREFNSSSIDQKLSSIAVGEDFVCGLSESGSITCGGSTNNAITGQKPKGNYCAIAAGFRHACHGLDCWGIMAGEKPKGEFISMALEESRGCALRTNETIVCWGQDNFSLPEWMKETYFITIEAKRDVFCGVQKSTSSLYCWGNEIFNSNLPVFEEVLPGPCRGDCPDGILEGSGGLWSQGQNICQRSKSNCTPPAVIQSPVPTPEPHRERRSWCNEWSEKMIAFIVVGCVRSLVILLVIGFFLFKYGQCRGCRVHDSGRLDGTEPGASFEQTGAPSRSQALESEQASPVLQKRLSELASMGNAGHLEEFSFQVLLEATNNFSQDKKIGTGSFGSVYQGTLDDGCEVAIKRAEISNTCSYAVGKRRQEDMDVALQDGVHRNVVDFVVPCIVQDEIHKVLDSRVPPPTPFEMEAVICTGYLAADCLTYEGPDRSSMADAVNRLVGALLRAWCSQLRFRSRQLGLRYERLKSKALNAFMTSARHENSTTSVNRSRQKGYGDARNTKPLQFLSFYDSFNLQL
ncbi:hypothetical protein OIU84_017383 [Salix udensis]|uniref:Protein kinase domain-containing protein n=1 Tax=Salix udensis TaxID=889485 RepID=A0AAD6L1R5_9ROSI|nr:hypothetical protein OIU84_017383 [Salix udensis]